MSPSIEFERVTKIYSNSLKRQAKVGLRDFSLEVRQGEVFGLLGPNGAGKTTAIKLLVNLLFPTAGEVRLLGRPVRLPETRSRLGYLPESPYFYDHLSVEELIRFAGRCAGTPVPQLKERASRWLDRMALSAVRGQRLRTFSKGMLQRAGLVVALVTEPDVIVLDEPMSGLDPIGRMMVADVIRELKGQGRTIFFSTHILADVENLCDRVGIIVESELRHLNDLRQADAPRNSRWKVRVPGAVGDLDLPGISRVARPDGADLIMNEDLLPAVLERLRKQGRSPMRIEPERPSLEEVFMQVLKEVKEVR